MDLTDITGTEFPLIQGGMANIATGEFAAAVSNAGGLGLIASGGFSCEQIKEEIAKARKLTDKPFGVNLMLMHPEVEQIADLLAEEKVPFVTTGAGNPARFMQKWKEAGIKVFPVVAAPTLAIMMERDGADAVIAEGSESGGHIGEMATMTLVPQVCDAVSIPVIAAGGIADHRQFLAAKDLGACGVQVGTALLASEECPIHENYKQAIVKAKGTDAVVTGRIGGTPVRVLKNRMTKEYIKSEKAGATMEELEKFTLGSLRRAVFEGDTKTGSLMAGQTAGQVKEIRPLRSIIEDICVGKEKA
ncbi:MAG: nitronate monooxygenase [Lachnospiraceae bacterium]|nr:nitronate monooxygenase [Lachnospiraceae bacterium]